MSDINIQKKLLTENNKSLPPNNRFFKDPQSYNLFQENTCITDAGQAVHTRDDIYLRGDEDKYDPYTGYLFDRGLLLDIHQRRRFEHKFISIDSRQRKKTEKIIIKQPIILDDNPLILYKNTVTIKHKHHDFSVGDTVQISNAVSKESILKSNVSTGPAFIIHENTNVLQIFHKYEYSKTIKLCDVKGDCNNGNFLGSIPINLINGTHKIYTHVDNFDESPEYFFVILPIKMKKKYTLLDFNFKLIFMIFDDINGCHIIQSTTEDTFTVEIPKSNNKNKYNHKIIGGGSNVSVAKVISIDPGYVLPNHYKISLGKVFENIISAKMVSSEIPYTGRNINEHNNKIYWNNLDDGDELFSITVTPGNYTIANLEKEINKLFNNMKIYINESTLITTIEAFRKIIIKKDHIVKSCKDSITIFCKEYIENNTEVKINNKFGIIKKTDKSHEYIIFINDESEGNNDDLHIYLPKFFQLRFDQKDSMVNILGFNCMKTDYNYTHSSMKGINLVGEPYILMVINELSTLTALGKVKEAFAKIQLCGKYNKILFNTFVDTFHNYKDPLNELSELTISFYNPDGTLYDFQDRDHSFTLELVTISDIPEGTGLTSNTGKNFNLEIG